MGFFFLSCKYIPYIFHSELWRILLSCWNWLSKMIRKMKNISLSLWDESENRNIHSSQLSITLILSTLNYLISAVNLCLAYFNTANSQLLYCCQLSYFCCQFVLILILSTLKCLSLLLSTLTYFTTVTSQFSYFNSVNSQLSYFNIVSSQLFYFNSVNFQLFYYCQLPVILF